MTTTPIAALQEHPAFRGLSQDGLAKINQNSKLLRFRIGQTITDRSTLPADVVFHNASLYAHVVATRAGSVRTLEATRTTLGTPSTVYSVRPSQQRARGHG